jgi:hypothetical protein
MTDLCLRRKVGSVLHLTLDGRQIFCFLMKESGSYGRRKTPLQFSASALVGAAQRGYALFILLMLLTVLPLSAKLDQNVEKPDTLYLGSFFSLTITADEALSKVVVPDTLDAFAIIKQEPLQDKKQAGGLKLTIAALDTGTNVFPSLVVMPVQPRRETLRTLSFAVTVNNTRAPEDSLLRDIAPTQKLKGELPWWAYYAIPAVLLLAMLIFILYKYHQYRKRKALEPRREPVMRDNRPNWKKALEELHALNQENLPAKGEFIAFHFRLSEIMKQFLEDDYGFSAKEMTSREIRHYLRQQKHLDASENRALTDWLDGCDLVKFAKQVPSVEACGERLDWFFRWLMQKRTVAEQNAGEKPSHD